MPWCARSTGSIPATRTEDNGLASGAETRLKVCIYGAGAIGGWLGVKLAGAGCEVTVVARGAALQALQAHGLSLQSGEDTVSVPVRASADPAALGPQDLVIVAVKAPAMAD